RTNAAPKRASMRGTRGGWPKAGLAFGAWLPREAEAIAPEGEAERERLRAYLGMGNTKEGEWVMSRRTPGGVQEEPLDDPSETVSVRCHGRRMGVDRVAAAPAPRRRWPRSPSPERAPRDPQRHLLPEPYRLPVGGTAAGLP